MLATWIKDPLNGARGVGLGRAVRVGGTSENDVGEGSRVNVGRGVLVAVSSNVGLGVHVDCNCSGVTVNVGIGFAKGP